MSFCYSKEDKKYWRGKWEKVRVVLGGDGS